MCQQLDRALEDLQDRLADGAITRAAYDRECREMIRDYGAEADEAAADAYRDELDRW